MCKSCFRNEIWMADIILHNSKGVMRGKHPILITSTFKHILKSDSINALVLTSNTEKKLLKSHVPIEGFGLLKPSLVLCEQILTINKEDLLFKIGKVDNVKMQEINSCLKRQLQLDSKHKNLESEDLEEIFMMGVKKMDELKQFKILQNEIYQAYLREQNQECINKADELIDKINKSKIENKNKFLWYSNYSKSLIFMRINDIGKALECTKESLKYIDEVDVFANDYTLSMQALARCYENYDIEKAIKTYEILSKVYRETTNNKMRITVLFNMSKLYKNRRAMTRLINIVDKTETNKWYFDIDKADFIKNMRLELDAIII